MVRVMNGIVFRTLTLTVMLSTTSNSLNEGNWYSQQFLPLPSVLDRCFSSLQRFHATLSDVFYQIFVNFNPQRSDASMQELKEERTENSPPKWFYRQQTMSSPQKGLKALYDFKQSLGQNAQFIFDDSGQIVGISLDRSEDIGYRHSDNIVVDNRYRTFQAKPRGDQDVCCSTYETFFINTTLKDVYGNSYTISQYSHVGSFQFIRHGLCGSPGLCQGQCVQTYVNLCLSVHPPEPGQRTTFKFFSIPGYCSCKVYG